MYQKLQEIQVSKQAVTMYTLLTSNLKGKNLTNSSFTKSEPGNQEQTLVKLWNISTVLGIIGTILNGMIFVNFYLERNAFFTVINVMIW